MTTRSIARPLALLASLTLAFAACGGPAATAAPGATQPGGATQPPATQGPGATDGAIPTIDTSSFHADVELEDLFPEDIGGEPVQVLSMGGAEFLSGGSAPEFDAMLSTLNKTASDLSVAFGGAGNVTIIAFQVEGVPGSSILQALINAFTAESEATITDLSFGGKSVKKVAPADGEETSYVYATQDVIFAVGGDDITDAQLNEAFQKLP